MVDGVRLLPAGRGLWTLEYGRGRLNCMAAMLLHGRSYGIVALHSSRFIETATNYPMYHTLPLNFTGKSKRSFKSIENVNSVYLRRGGTICFIHSYMYVLGPYPTTHIQHRPFAIFFSC